MANDIKLSEKQKEVVKAMQEGDILIQRLLDGVWELGAKNVRDVAYAIQDMGLIEPFYYPDAAIYHRLTELGKQIKL